MPKIISGTTTAAGYTLTGGSFGTLNPVTVTGSIDIGAGAIPAALYAQGPGAWTVTNQGSITGGLVAGIELAAGGTVINASAGFLNGHIGVSIQGVPGSVSNAGVISALNPGASVPAYRAVGVLLSAGGAVSNDVSGQIVGQGAGIQILGGAGSVTNAGTISGPSYDGVYLDHGIVTNLAGGGISGGSIATGGSIGAGGSIVTSGWGVAIRNGGTLSNAGIVTGTGQGGAFLGGGLVTNQGLIDGVWGVAMTGAVGTVVNSGSLNGSGQSGVLLTGGSVTNTSGGRITGISGVVIRSGAGTVVNSGTIGATSPAGASVYFQSGFTNRLVDNPGAVFAGLVDGGNPIGAAAITTLVLGAAAQPGTLSGLGTQFVNFGQVIFDSGGVWALSGQNTVAAGATLLNQGSLAVNGSLLLNGSLVDAGPMTIAGGANTVASAIVSAGQWTGVAALVVGGAGAGSLFINNNGAASAGNAVFGLNAGGTGELDVTGPGSRFTATGLLTAGQLGRASLVVENQATLLTGGAGAAGSGIDLGLGLTGVGDLTVTGANALLSNAGRFIVGDSGLGSVKILAGGSVVTSALAPQVVATALATVNNGVLGGTGFNNSSVLNTGTLFAAAGAYEVTGGVSGTGVLEIDAGGILRLDSAVGTGQVVNFTANNGTLVIGNLAAFTPAIINGFVAGDAIALPHEAFIEPSYNAASGQLDLMDNGGSTIQTLVFSNKPAASAILGGLLLPIGAIIGNQAGSDGSSVTVAGPTSRWDITGELDVGGAAAGGLTIVGGATVTASQGQVGLLAGSSGNINIEGANSNLVILNDLTIGATGTGVLTLGNGTKLTVVDNLVVGRFGVINQFGGVIDPTHSVNSGSQGPTGATLASIDVENNGTYFAANGTYAITAPIIHLGSLSGTGLLQIQDNGNLVLNAAVDGSQTVAFNTAIGTLTIGTIGTTVAAVTNPGTVPVIATFAPAAINGFVAGDTIVVKTAVPATFSLNGSIVSVLDGGLNTLGSLKFATATAAADAVNTAGALVDQVLACFAAGTRIETTGGPVAVESLRVGDAVRTVAGGPGRIVWVGSRTVDCARHPRPEAVWPVRIARDAFGPNVPARDLFVSPDHAIYVDGVLIPAKLLVNGARIRQVEWKTVTYHHIELERHDIVLAEGLTVETYLDTGDRAAFSGGAVVSLYPDFAARTWEMAGCAELVQSGPVLEAVRRRLARMPDRGPRRKRYAF